MDSSLAWILPISTASQNGHETHETPFGTVQVSAEHDVQVLRRDAQTDGRSLIYAAKSLGVRQLFAVDTVQPISPLLEPGDIVVPGDIIDLTKLRPFTFFVGKGYGFIKLNPPFCPLAQRLLHHAARTLHPRAFRRAVYIATEGARAATTAELRMFRQWGGDVVGSQLIPEAYLARELEICYGTVTLVGGGDVVPVLRAASAQAQTEPTPTCGCRHTMTVIKQDGVVGEDWRTWLG